VPEPISSVNKDYFMDRKVVYMERGKIRYIVKKGKCIFMRGKRSGEYRAENEN
jgi:hypothetical protein